MRNSTWLFLLVMGVSLVTSCFAFQKNELSKIQVILDTDANAELDDQHAIAYLLFNGDVFDVEGITVNRTCQSGTIAQQVAEAKRVVRLCGLDSQVKVYQGADGSFNEIRGMLNAPCFDGEEAVNFIIESVKANEGQKLVLLPIGKLTNIALALAKSPEIASKIRIVWLGSNYPDPGEYNQINDEPALSYILESNVEFEIVLVRGGKTSGTDAVRVTLEEIKEKMSGKGIHISPPVSGRHGGEFTCFGDYSIDLFKNIKLRGNPPSRALFDMAMVAIIKNPSWARPVIIPAPLLKIGTGEQGKWVDRPNNNRKIKIWENFNRDAIMADFYKTMSDPNLVREFSWARTGCMGI